jgi:hypothetical protein
MHLVDTVDLSSQNTYSTGIKFYPGKFHLLVTGFNAATATVHVQRSTNNTNWYDVDSFSADIQQNCEEVVGAYWRSGIKAGNYTGGIVTVTITQFPKPDIFDI